MDVRCWQAGGRSTLVMTAPPCRRCESIDEAMNLVMERDHLPAVSFPQNIKTVTAATILRGPEDHTAGLQVTSPPL